MFNAKRPGCCLIAAIMGLLLLGISAAAYDNADSFHPGWNNVNSVSYGTGAQSLWYYCDENGDPLTGWQWMDDTWYYFEEEGPRRGAMCTEKWVGVGYDTFDGYTADYYYLTSSGVMAIGWQLIPRQLPNRIEYNWYYFSADGKCRTGWQYTDGSWFYLGYTGQMATGWLNISDIWYYFKSTGAMAANETIAGYTFDSSGVWIG